ncbi:MAG: NAD(P)H-hydrate dehydratase, partial [Verrucomicrobiota bacterium]|nr:NAD(P)H-hydrate dehydratase [Verrucomicrobiota bacterium]
MALPVITVEQMRRWEAATWESGKPEEEVIAQVGEVVAARAIELTQPGDAILLLAGKGHNGDDVRAMAGHLPKREVSLMSVTDPAKTRQKLPLDLDPAPALVVDGLFGIGLNRTLNADWMQVIAQINAKQLRVLSVDTPSGIDAASGEVQGAAIRATETLTLGAVKRGLLKPSASEFIGRLRVAPDIGLATCREASDLLLGQAADFSGFPPVRPAGGHKGTFGHLGIMAGSLGYHGAAVLAARGAARAQPGLVTLLTPNEVFAPVASQLQSVMVRPLVPGEITIHSITGLLIGPGLAADDLPTDLKETTGEMWRESSVPMVVDASALDWLPSGKIPEKSIRVITPHPGEAARLLSSSADAVQADRVEALRALSAKFGNCWVMLKGQHTLIGHTEGEVFVNSTGNPALGQ